MGYAHILEMLDEYLDRLTRARQLLMTLEGQAATAEALPSSRSKQAPQRRDAAVGKQARAKKRETNKSKGNSVRTRSRATEVRSLQKELFPEEAVNAAVPETRREMSLKAKEKAMAVQPETSVAPVTLQAAEPKRETRRRQAPPMPRALGGMVSATPVFISAEKVRQELTQKAEAAKDEIAIEPPITAELLTQRWVQGLVS